MNQSKQTFFPRSRRLLKRCLQLLKPAPSSPTISRLCPQTQSKLKHFHTKAEQINQLTAQLETRIWELKAIATHINQDRHLHRLPSSSPQICTYRSVRLPIIQKKADHFLLTSYSLDLFQAEREAVSLANTLRQRAKKKRR